MEYGFRLNEEIQHSRVCEESEIKDLITEQVRGFIVS